jgi:hypothetical protein
MATPTLARRLPGLVAFLLLVAVATVAAISGLSSVFYEGWGQPAWTLWPHLAPAVALVAIGLVALRRPRLGAALLLVAGLTSGALWFRGQLSRGVAAPADLLVMLGVMLGPIAIVALLLLVDAWVCARPAGSGGASRGGWLATNWRGVVLVGVPLACGVIISAQQLPALLARRDDGLRGARVIAGGATSLVWAPQGPGWNGRSTGGRYLSWAAVARHENGPMDRCAYLNEDGSALLDSAARLWRMPTANEIIEALSRDGASAGCRWDGRSPHAVCRTPPDKETPLWAPDEAPIYYWSNQEASPGLAIAVNYTGGISVLPARVEGLGVGFRCVKSAPAS